MNGRWIRKNQDNVVVIFVHGILSSATECWKNENGVNWPELLMQNKSLCKTGIYTFSYNTGVFSGSYSLGDVVDSFKEQLSLDAVITKKCHLIFVCHSMGGIVARKYIVDRQADLISNEIKVGIFLVASPSLGSDYANLVTGLAKILKIKNYQAEVLRFAQNNLWLNDLDKNFLNLKESQKLEIKGKELIEDKSVILPNFFKKQVVEPFSGARYFGEQLKIPNSDHISISKPKSSTELQHKILCKFIIDFAYIHDIGIDNIKNPDKSDELYVDITRENQCDFISNFFQNRLELALSAFSSQPIVWVEPTVSQNSELSRGDSLEGKIDLFEFVKNPRSVVIKAPPEFGLTCLSHYLIVSAWANANHSLWLYLDADELKPHTSVIEKHVTSSLGALGKYLLDVKCVVLDSWKGNDEESIKLISKISEYFKDIPLIVMQTVDDIRLLNQYDGSNIDRKFDALYLWALPRGHVRQIVCGYNDFKEIGNEDLVIERIISDIDVLNIHRTPLNCLTLLKIFEKSFDESPVNRADMISKILFLLFNVDNIPSYKPRPDMKDCEFVLGRFCERLFRENNFLFTRKTFVDDLESYCREEFIDLEVHVVFDVLYENHIIIDSCGFYRFRFSYWIYYFLAQRMYHCENFAKYVLEEKRYTKFPEVIEFYTGIDRRRSDALNVLIQDIGSSCERVRERCGLPDGLNPYRFAKWQPSSEALEQMKDEIKNGVQGSSLPETIKDGYADMKYDRSKPYNQEIRDIFSEHSFVIMMQAMKAGSRALRNSDYAPSDIKCLLLDEITKCWEQIVKVMMVLMPLLAIEGEASFEGQGFLLCGNFGKDPFERMQRILLSLPHNAVFLVQDDLYSKKMGPLLLKQFDQEINVLKKHIMAIIFINNRPNNWKTQIEQYISSIDKNSFYLFDIYQALRLQYRYSYSTKRDLDELEYLIKLSAAKHHKIGHLMPSKKHIKNIVSERVLPERDPNLNL
ncbi:hypothetical protein [Methylomicrobium sp. Wu6]|uniref:esterase/lipase family protein n=1 Tax=Methylomicrobium sp. Wu6 TaxID=3107928 RepID=UPI002DD64C9C|nr:hypothetical protein [Methylomicrobium sp. Wu6]MEC4749939.1 hypothetical protein [Methylomicrobium sp. Wu6]